MTEVSDNFHKRRDLNPCPSSCRIKTETKNTLGSYVNVVLGLETLSNPKVINSGVKLEVKPGIQTRDDSPCQIVSPILVFTTVVGRVEVGKEQDTEPNIQRITETHSQRDKCFTVGGRVDDNKSDLICTSCPTYSLTMKLERGNTLSLD